MSVRQTNPTQNKSQLVDLKSLLSKYIYHWPLFILGLMIAFAGAYFYMQITNKVYEVSATILVKDEKKSPEEKSALPELDQTSSPKNAEAEIEIVKSKNLITKVVDTLQLWTAYKFKTGLKTQDLYESSPFKFVMIQKAGMLPDQSVDVLIKDSHSFVVKNLSGHDQVVAFNTPVKSAFGTWTLKPTTFLDQYTGSNITVELSDPQNVANDYVKSLDVHLLDKLAPTIGLFITDEVPKRGQDFLNNLIKAYNDAAAVEQKKKTKSTIDFIDNRLASLTGELGKAEKNVEGYRSSQGITDISSQTKAYLENSQANGSKLNDVNIQLGVINNIESYVNSSSENPPSTMGITDPTLNSQIDKLVQLQLKRSALLATTPENNPMFEPINRQIALTKESIKQNIQSIKASLLSSKRQLQVVSNQNESSIRDIPVQERQFVDMKRTQSIKENLYVYLLQKREELALSYASSFSDARVVDQANVGDIKWPRTSLVFIVALLCGLGLPFLIIYFRESFNNKITSRRDIETNLSVPIIGELSYENTGKHVLVVDKKRNLIGEQFRALRTNLHYLHQNKTSSLINQQSALNKQMAIDGITPDISFTADNKGRVTLLTSSISKEGKSFVSANLAASLSASSRRTVLLEMDLRKPKITGIFDLPANHPGISDYMLHNAPLDSVIQHPEAFPNLDIIGCGPIPDEPSEMLETERLSDLINELRERYEDIVIDSPPLHLVTDAMIIAKEADVSLYVVRQGYSGKDELDFIRDTNESEKLPNMNIVFNGIKRNKYGYGYNYDNSYYSSKPDRPSFSQSFKNFMSRF